MQVLGVRLEYAGDEQNRREARGDGVITSCVALQNLSMMYTHESNVVADFPCRINRHHQYRLPTHRPT